MRKVRFIAWILVVAMMMAEISIPAFADGSSGFAGGSGTEDDPYQIANKVQLELMRDRVNSGTNNYRTASYILTSDIDLNPGKWYIDENNDVVFEESSEAFKSIGRGYTFQGSFDGAGHTISGLYFSGSGNDGDGLLFHKTENAVIENLNVYGRMDCGSYGAGGIVYSASGGKIINCISNVTIHAQRAGGIVYTAGAYEYRGEIENCVNNGNLYCLGECGGIAGGAYKITNCVNKGNISLLGNGTRAGGVACSVRIVNGCYNYGNVSTIYNNNVSMAGIAYQVFEQIYDCYNYGDIYNPGEISGTTQVGGNTAGIVVRTSANINNCLNAGNIVGSQYVGGIISTAEKSQIISKCMNIGNVTGELYIGGIAGLFSECSQYPWVITPYYGAINTCANTGEISGIMLVGGILGFGHGYADYNGSNVLTYSWMSVSNTYNSHAVKKKVPSEDELNVINNNKPYYISYRAQSYPSYFKYENNAYIGSIIGCAGDYCSVSRGYSIKSERTSSGLTPSQMRNAESYKGFDFSDTWAIDPDINNGYPYIKSLKQALTEYRKCIKITVPNGFAGQAIQIKSKGSEEAQKVYITESKNEYKFFSLSNGEYDVALVSARGDVFAEENNVVLNQSVVEINFSDAPAPRKANLTITDNTGKIIDGGYAVKWYNADGKYISQGNSITSLKSGSTVYYEIIPENALSETFIVPPKQHYTVSDDNSISVSLMPRQKTAVSGKVLCDGVPVSNAYISISQKINERLSKNASFKTDHNGSFMFDALAGTQTDVVISKNGYFNAEYHYDALSGNYNFDLTRLDGITIATAFSVNNAASGSTEAVGSKTLLPENIDFIVTNTTKHQQISDYMYQNSAITIKTGAEIGDAVSVTAMDTQGEFLSDTQTVTIGNNNRILFEMTEKGGILAKILSADQEAVLCLYDSTGNYLVTKAFDNDISYIGNLDSGTYNAVIMAKSFLFNALPTLSDYSDYSLLADQDYTLLTLDVVDGIVSEIAVDTIPDFDETAHGFVNCEKSYIAANTASVVPGNNVYIKIAYSVKDSYSGSLASKSINALLPDGCSVVSSVTLDGKTTDYTVDDNVLNVSASKDEGILRLYVKPTNAGKAQISGYLQFDYNNSTKKQLLGSLEVEMKELSLTMPEKTARTSIAVNGQVSPNTVVKIYDNNVPVCDVTSNKSGHFSASVALLGVPEITEHIVYAEIITESAKIKSRSYKLIYDENYTALSLIVMSYNGSDMTFNYIEPSGIPSYTFVPSKPQFDFTAYFEGNKISDITDVYVVTLGSDGKNTKVPLTYDPATNSFKGSYDYNSTTCPRSVGATYSIVSNTASASGTASASDTYSADDTYISNVKNTEAATPTEAMCAAVTAVAPNQASNGKITVKISGVLLKANMQASLTNGIVTIQADKLYWFNHQNVYATFDMTNATDGTYSLVCENNRETLRLENCLTLDSALPKGQLEAEFHIGGNIKTGTEYKGSVTFANNGYTDVAAPIVSLSGDNVLFKTDDELSDSIYEFAANKEGIAGVVGHGERAAINFIYQAENDGEFEIYALTLEEMGGSLFEEISADANSNSDAVLLSNIADLSGRTAKAYMKRAQERANLLDSLGEESIDYSALESIDYYNANAILGIETLSAAVDLVSAELSFSRRYSSAITDRYTKGSMGYGWSTDYSVTAEHNTAEETSDEYIAVTTPDKLLVFIKDGDTFIEPLSEYYTASFENNRVTVSAKDGSYLEFNTDGTLYRSYDAYGKFTQYHYADGRLSEISSENGDALTLAYSGDKLTEITSTLTGDSVTYGYSGDYLTSVSTMYGTTLYAYDTDSTGGKRHALTRIQYADGSYDEFSYDGFGRVTAISDSGGTVSLDYGDYNDVTVTDEIGNTSHVYFDLLGNAVRAVDAAGNVSTAEYGYFTQPQSASVGFFNNYSYSYDEAHRLTEITDNDGNAVNYTYDLLGNIASVSDKRGIVTEYERDSKGRTTALVYADGSREQYSYDARGNMTRMTKRSGVSVSYAYDAFDRVTQERYSTGETREFTYDARGKITSITENGETTAVSYNERGDIALVAYPNGKAVSYAYDSIGRMTSMTDHEGNTTYYSYDSESRLASVTSGTASTAYTYDAAGNLVRKANSNGTVTEYTYENSMLASITNKGAGGAVLSLFAYTYDEYGNISSMTDKNGTWHYTYDKSGQLTKTVSPDGDITEYAYDLSGNRTSVTVNGNNTAYTANSLNQYTQISDKPLSYDADGNMILDAEGGAYEYDYLDRLVKYTAPDGSVFEYGYDAFGNRNSVTANGDTTEYLNTPTGYGYVLAEYNGDRVRRYIQGAGLTAMLDGDGIYFYSFNHLGSASEITDVSGAVANSYQYDAEGRVTERNERTPNPFTYVGEYGIADDKNGLYYMRARYVSQRLGRFINVDPLGQSADLNVYRYTGNNYINSFDITGYEDYTAFVQHWGYNSTEEMFAYGNMHQYDYFTPTYRDWAEFILDFLSTDIGQDLLDLSLSIIPGSDCVSSSKYANDFVDRVRKGELIGDNMLKDMAYSFVPFSNSIKKMFVSEYLETTYHWDEWVICTNCGYKAGYLNKSRSELKLIREATIFELERIIRKREDNDKAEVIRYVSHCSHCPPDSPYSPPLPANPSIDPSGYVYEAVPSNRLKGVTATIFYKEASETDDEFAELWDAEEYDQDNPLTTDSEGGYAWDVPDGWWQVRFEKDGYDIAYSEWLPVPPPQTDINVGIISMAAPMVTECERTESGYKIAFSQYMNIGSVNSDNVFLVEKDGSILTGTITPLNAETAGDPELAEVGVKYASEFELSYSDELPDSTRLYVGNVYNYAGTFMDGEYMEAEYFPPEISDVRVSKNDAEYEFHITLSHIPPESYVVAALYDSGKFVGSKIVNIDSALENEELTVLVTASYATDAKVFILSEDSLLRPLCKAKSVSLKGNPIPAVEPKNGETDG